MPGRLLLGLAMAALWTTAPHAETPAVAGWLEHVAFPDQDLVMVAKLDTGADSSSLNVTGLERFKRQGKTWYRFTLHGEGGKTATVEQESDRIARIMRAEVEDTRRPIVRLKICLAGHVAETDFTLTDRSDRRAAVLIGRRFLAERVLVDSGRKHLFPKPCEAGK